MIGLSVVTPHILAHSVGFVPDTPMSLGHEVDEISMALCLDPGHTIDNESQDTEVLPTQRPCIAR
jgi:hypothetical protein